MKSKGGLVFVSADNNGIDENLAPTTSLIAVSASDSADARATAGRATAASSRSPRRAPASGPPRQAAPTAAGTAPRHQGAGDGCGRQLGKPDDGRDGCSLSHFSLCNCGERKIRKSKRRRIKEQMGDSPAGVSPIFGSKPQQLHKF
jgi:hypothetical protein